MPGVRSHGVYKIILFGAVFLLLLTLISSMMTPVEWFDDFRVQNRNARITQMMKQDPQTIDILNMGDSLSLSSLTPMELWREKGYTSFSIGADGIRMPEAYYTIIEAAENQSPKYLMLEYHADPEGVEDFIQMLKPYGILEIQRTGTIALEKN